MLPPWLARGVGGYAALPHFGFLEEPRTIPTHDDVLVPAGGRIFLVRWSRDFSGASSILIVHGYESLWTFRRIAVSVCGSGHVCVRQFRRPPGRRFNTSQYAATMEVSRCLVLSHNAWLRSTWDV